VGGGPLGRHLVLSGGGLRGACRATQALPSPSTPSGFAGTESCSCVGETPRSRGSGHCPADSSSCERRLRRPWPASSTKRRDCGQQRPGWSAFTPGRTGTRASRRRRSPFACGDEPEPPGEVTMPATPDGFPFATSGHSRSTTTRSSATRSAAGMRPGGPFAQVGDRAAWALPRAALGRERWGGTFREFPVRAGPRHRRSRLP